MNNNEVIAEKPFPKSGITNKGVAFSAHHSCRTKHRNTILILSYYFDLQSCLHNYNRLACWVFGNALERFGVKVVKLCSFGLVEITLVMMMFSCLQFC